MCCDGYLCNNSAIAVESINLLILCLLHSLAFLQHFGGRCCNQFLFAFVLLPEEF